MQSPPAAEDDRGSEGPPVLGTSLRSAARHPAGRGAPTTVETVPEPELALIDPATGIGEVPLDPVGRSFAVGRRALRSGSTALTLALIVNGVADYLFLTTSGRALGPARFTQVSVLWAVLFLVGNGLYIPLEQELGRSISARRARGVGYGTLVHRVSLVAWISFAVIGTTLLLFRSRLAESLFRGDESFVFILAFGIFGIAAMFLVRGWLAGTHRFHSYAAMFVGDAIAKAIPPIGLWIAGVGNPAAYGLVMAASALVGVFVPWRPGTDLGEPGPAPEWSPLMQSLGWLLMTSLLSALAMNIGTVAVEFLARPSEADRAGVFLSGLVIARVPLFLFQGVQALVLPKLSHQAASGDMVGLRRSTAKLLVALGLFSLVATVAAGLVGPTAVQVLFGDDFALLSGRDMAMLTLASMLMMGALTINQAQIALHHQRQTGWPWGAACLVFVATAALGGEDLFLQVETAMVATGLAVLVLAGGLLWRELRRPDLGRHDLPAL